MNLETILSTLAEQGLEPVRAQLVAILVDGTWAERVAVLRELAGKHHQVNADGLLLELDSRASLPSDGTVRDEDEAAFVSSLLAELGLVLLRLMAPWEAASLCWRAIRVAPSGGLQVGRAKGYHHLGVALLALGDQPIPEGEAHRAGAYPEPQEALLAAVKQFQGLGDPQKEGEVLDSLGRLHFERLELDDAEYYFQRSLALKSQVGDLAGQAITYGNLGRVALTKGERELALERFYRDRKLSAQIGDLHGVAIMSNQLAETWIELGKLDRAAACLEEGREAAQGRPWPADDAHYELMLGRLALVNEHHELARGHLERALARFDDLGDGDGTALATMYLGALTGVQGDVDQALALLERSRALFADELGDLAGEAEVRLELALLFQRRGDSSRCLEQLGEARALARRLGRTALRYRIFRMYAQLAAGQWLRRVPELDGLQVDGLIELSYRTGQGLGRLLMRGAALEEKEYERILREYATIDRLLDPTWGPAASAASGLLPHRLATQLRVVPVRDDGVRLVVGMSDPLDYHAIERVEIATGRKLSVFFLPEDWLSAALGRLGAFEALALERLSARSARTAVDRLIAEAVELGASDLHVEPGRGGYRIRGRLDGMLQELDRVSQPFGRQLVSRFKVMAKMDIAEIRRPQDGRLQLELPGMRATLRLSTLPTVHGENLVARVLAEAAEPGLAELGFDASTLGRLEQLATRQEGLMVAAGPTGSGKSSTLSALLRQVDAVERAVFTIEDPVEFEVDGFAQSQVRPAIGYGFAEALRSVLRQDPDVILLGEMRDPETAGIATRMALTGHLVLSTLHTYDAASAVTRLIDMGVPRYVVAAVLEVVLAQRLVRRLCPSCRTPRPLDSVWQRRFDPEGKLLEVLKGGTIFGPQGRPDCELCKGVGYRGRIPVWELLMLDEDMKQIVRGSASAQDLRLEADRRGIQSLYANAVLCVAAGETSQEEVMRVL